MYKTKPSKGISNTTNPPTNCQESFILPSTLGMNDGNPDLTEHELYLPLAVPFYQMKTFLASPLLPTQETTTHVNTLKNPVLKGKKREKKRENEMKGSSKKKKK